LCALLGAQEKEVYNLKQNHAEERVTWAVALKYADGFTKLVPSEITIIGYIASLILLSFAMKSLPLGTSYATWTGIGIVGTTLLGIFLFNKEMSRK
jgi:quaternary ammonium compound-resistance protein SugE